jgi:hypothetical protein
MHAVYLQHKFRNVTRAAEQWMIRGEQQTCARMFDR